MKITFTSNPAKAYLHYELSDTYTFNEAVKVFRSLKAECERQKYTKAFIDILRITNDIPQLDRFKLGEQAAVIWGSQIQVAILGDPARVNKFFENVAVNRLTQVRVFTEPQAAWAWLGIEKAG